MTKKQSFIKAVLSDACLIFVGVFGALSCVTSAYHFLLQYDILAFIIAISSIFASTIYHLKKRARLIAIITVYSAIITLFVLKLKTLAAGGVVFLNTIINLLRRIYIGLSLIKMPETENFILTQDLLLFFFGFIAVLLAMLLAWALIRLKSPFICLVLTLPFFATSVIFVNWMPSLSSILLFLAFLFTTFLTNNIRLGKTNTGSGVTLALPVLAFLIILNLLNPQENYKRSDFGTKLYDFVASYFQLEADVPATPEDSVPTDTSMPSGMAPQVDPNLLSLRNARPPQGTNTVFSIRFPHESIQYLRGASYTDYINSSWMIGKQSEFSKENLAKINAYNTISFNLMIDGSTFPYEFMKLNLSTFIALYPNINYDDLYSQNSFVINKEINTATFEVRDSKNYLTFAYMPYFSFNTNMLYSRFKITDDYIARLPTKQALEFYSFKVFSPKDIGNIDSFWNQKYDVNKDIKTYIENFYSIDKNQLTKVPDDLYNYLYSLLENEGLLNDESDFEKAKKIAAFVKNSATYSINVPKTPENADFVRYFLETTKEGFCVHFATAATMMMRTAGIPARYVTGYVEPTNGDVSWNPVLENQAHAWTEVFIDGAGWLPIDATPGIPGLTEPTNTSNPSDESGDTQSQTSSPGTTEQSNSPTQSTDTSSESSESSENSLPGEVRDFGNWYIALIIAAPFVLVILIFVLRRRIILNRRERLFNSTDTNKATIAAWKHIEKLLPYGITPSETVHELALMAAFSKHILTKDQVKTVVSYAKDTSMQVYNALPLLRRFIFKHFKCLI